MQLNRSLAGYRTPCPGLIMRRTEKGWGVLRVHFSADPELVDEYGVETPKLLALRDRISNEADWNLEMEIGWEAKNGQLVYPEFREDLHVIADEMIPPRLVRYMSLDPHPRTPHAILWAGVDLWDDVYVYREYWPSIAYGRSISVKDSDMENHTTATVKDYAEIIAQLEGNRIEFLSENSRRERGRYVYMGGERIYQRFSDQAGKGFLVSGENESKESYDYRYRSYGIKCQDPNKRHNAGLDAIRALLKSRRHEVYGEWPRLHIARSCRELISEFRNYRFKMTRRPSEERELKQNPVEARCHMLDNLRYLATAGIGYIRGWES